MMGILDLSAHTRHDIFIKAGLYNSQIVDLGRSPYAFIAEDRLERLSFPLSRSQAEERRHRIAMRERLDKQLLPIRLMLTCRIFYHDVLYMLATANYLHMNLAMGGKLKTLRCLPDLLVSNMRNLTIQLRTSLCINLGECIHDRYAHACADGPTAISLASRQDRQLIDEWCDLWYKWASLLPREPLLALRLICDVMDKETAHAILRPFLHASRPLFRRCTIRMSGRPCLNMRAIADAAVLACTLDPPGRPTGSFAFLKLPAELRRQILLQTDLVTAYQRLSWSPTYHVDKRPVSIYGCSSAHSPHGAVPSTEESSGRCAGVRSRRRYLFGCLCQTKHTVAGYDHVVMCDQSCWIFPTALLQTCRQVYTEAMHVALQYNAITVRPSERSWEDPGVCHRSLAVAPPPAAFLRRVSNWPSAWYLRKLHIIQEDLGCPSHADLCIPGSSTEREWIAALASARTALNLYQLMLSIEFQYCGSLDINGFIQYPSGFDFDNTLSYCANTLIHIRLLEGLRHFFVYLSGPEEAEGALSFPAGSEAQLERLVMGPDYDAFLAGKPPKAVRKKYGD